MKGFALRLVYQKNSGGLERAFVLVVTPLVSIMKDEVEERCHVSASECLPSA